jgi:hypothetical protein
MEALAYRFLRVSPSIFKLERYFELFCVKFVGRRQTGERLCFINRVVRDYNQDMDLDEVALNTLLAEGIDVPTAVAGSAHDRLSQARPIRAERHWAWYVGLLVGVALFLFWLLV